MQGVRLDLSQSQDMPVTDSEALSGTVRLAGIWETTGVKNARCYLSSDKDWAETRSLELGRLHLLPYTSPDVTSCLLPRPRQALLVSIVLEVMLVLLQGT